MPLRNASAVVLLGCLGIPSTALSLTIQVSGTVTNVGIEQELVEVGDPITGTIVFDETIATTTTSTSTALLLEIPPPPLVSSVNLTVGGFPISANPNAVDPALLEIVDVPTHDALRLVVWIIPSFQVFTGNRMGMALVLTDDDGTAFSPVAIPTTLNTSDFESAVLATTSAARDGISMHISSISVVPEPRAAALLLIGVCLLAWAFRRTSVL